MGGARPAAVIREYEPATDATAVRARLVELQEHEREIEASLLPGEEMADRYLGQMFSRCAELDGQVFVADVDGDVCGFVCVWATVSPSEADEDPRPYAYVSDLVVTAARRRRGMGRALLDRAEQYARAAGAGRLRIGVLARNTDAWRLYRAFGFDAYLVQLRKAL
jgi:ribosomal protein S18 acetylase RimI-like enzyme